MFDSLLSGTLTSMNKQLTDARSFPDAIVAGNFDALGAALAPGVRFRFMTPSRVGEAIGSANVAAQYRAWFGDADRIEVLDVRSEPLADRISLRYRLLVHEPTGPSMIEQQVFLDVDEEGRIASMDLLCSGFRHLEEHPEPAGKSHEFDAGRLSCADGLAQEFRRRILAIPPGDVLMVETQDPAAKEDLPPLARMMGHTVRSIESRGDGRLLITVERGR